MFPFSSDSPPDESLTPLPARLSLRTSSPASSASAQHRTTLSLGGGGGAGGAGPYRDYPAAGTGGGVSEWGTGGFSALLSQDPRRASIVSTAHLAGQNAAGGGRGGRPDSNVALLEGGHLAVVGTDAPLLLQEIDRQRSSAVHRKHRHLALYAGLLSLLASAFTFWLIFEAAWALVDKGGKKRGVARYVELGLALVAFAACGVVIAWLKRCTWGIDAAWDFTASGKVCAAGTSIIGWSVAASIRIIITLIFSFILLSSLRTFHRSLSITSIIDPTLLPSLEARTILASGRASLVPSSPFLHNHPSLSNSPNALPAMPIRGAHYSHPSDATTYYANSDWSDGRELLAGSPAGTAGGLASWAGSKLWRGVGWIFGVEPYQAAPQVDVDMVEKGEKNIRRPTSGGGGGGGQRDELRSEESGRVFSPEDMDLILEEDRAREAEEASSSNHAPRSSTGSSGSTGGSLVFVRMSDGRLVRKLSTIASEASESNASRSPSSMSMRRPASSVYGGREAQYDEDGMEIVELADTHVTVDLGYQDVVLAGDSAGGGLAFTLLFYLKNLARSPNPPMNLVLPSAVLLYSPWVDLTLSSYRSGIPAEHLDDFLNLTMINYTAEAYLTNTFPRSSDPPLLGLDQSHPFNLGPSHHFFSPALKSNASHLADLHDLYRGRSRTLKFLIFAGGAEVFSTEIRALAQTLKDLGGAKKEGRKGGVKVDFWEEPDEVHGFMMVPRWVCPAAGRLIDSMVVPFLLSP
ncbi:hypothetical protein RQP46_002441 [Phenoliferia psychrophenolica]